MNRIVKRKGHLEDFDIKKLYASIYSACMALRIQEEEAELIADKTSQEVIALLEDKDEVTSHQIYLLVIEVLSKYHPDAAFLYETHRDIS